MQCCSKQPKTTDAIFDILEPFSLDCLPETPDENFTRNSTSNLLFNRPKKSRPKDTVRAICLEEDSKRNDASLFETPKNDDSFQSPDTFSWEDSGFGTLEVDDTHNSYMGLDGSFQELLLHSASRKKDYLNQSESTVTPRLEHRLSTLRDEGSQPEEAISETESAPGHLQPELNIRKVYIGGKHDKHFLEKTVPKTSSDADLSLVPALQVVHAKFRWSAMLAEQKDVEGTQPLRMTMPLVGLIGKKMGLERLDILSELKKRNLTHIFTRIINMLSCEDICRFGLVSDFWNEMVVQDKMAFQRRRSFLKMQQMSLQLATVPDAATRLNRPCRSPLMSVQAQAKTPHSHTPLPGNGSFTIVKHGVKHSASKREEFLEVAKTLFNDECLRPCPRCQHPARCHSIKREGVCSWGDCGFQFCTGCLCTYHGSKDCGGWSFKHCDRKEVLAGSTQSKHNLRRL
ncbi:F-box only protein 43 [Conger conger]|uniref:F-box only protein 43 n=1 Tax=Conger conger TaxID=82655 RepID=UPI002A59D9D2|nr:F-box only protein 43 [Conger conger]